MKKNGRNRGILGICLIVLTLLSAGCTKSPDEVREWIRDKRAPQKMAEFIQNERFSLESKVEAVMVLVER